MGGHGAYGGMAGWGGSGWGGPMLFGGVFWLLLIVLVVGAVVWFARTASRPHDPVLRPSGSSGLDILQQRYARGEIDRDEYLQKRRDLLDHGTTWPAEPDGTRPASVSAGAPGPHT